MLKSNIKSIGVRSYHSISHSKPIQNANSIKHKIFENSLKYVPEYGFTQDSLIKSTRNLKFPDSSLSVLFSSSSYSSQLYQFYLSYNRAKLSESELSEEIIDKKTYLIQQRLLMNAPYIHHLSSGLGASMIDSPASLMEELHLLSDEIVTLSGVGKNAHSADWYALRLGVSSVYAASELFMMSDRSTGFTDTTKFVKEQCQSLDYVGSAVSVGIDVASFNLIGAANLIKSQLLRG